jgi:hypothetical protein
MTLRRNIQDLFLLMHAPMIAIGTSSEGTISSGVRDSNATPRTQPPRIGGNMAIADTTAQIP